jgi:ABC-2 type transport system permease protein
VLHVVRDKATLAQVIVAPVIQLLLLSTVATFTIKSTPAYVVDFDRTPTSRGVITRLAASGDFSIVGSTPSPDLANDAMLHGDVTMVMTIPKDFESSLMRTGTAPVQLDLNAEKGSAAGIVAGYAGQILAAYSAELSVRMRPGLATVRAGDVEPPPAAGVGRIEIRTRSLYNPTLNYKHYMVPGILVALVTMIGTLLTAQNIAREKEAGTLEQLNVTPITKGQFIAAKLLPFWVLALADMGIGLAVGHLVFGVPVRGSVFLLFGAAAIYLVVALGIGLWISTVVETQQQAMFVTFFFIMIYLLMSGLLTPIDSMPGWVQALSELNPVRHFVTISRAILVKGAGFTEIERPLGILVLYAGVVFTLAVRQYSKRTG